MNFSLCENCSHMRVIVSGKGSRFLLCEKAQQDRRFPKYPPQPIGQCVGFVSALASETPAGTGSEKQVWTLSVLTGTYAVCRLPAGAPVPTWVEEGSFFALVKTPEETSLIANVDCVPKNVRCESDWKLLRVVGTLDFSLTGVIAGLTNCLANAGVSVFVQSTFDTDYLMVREEQLQLAIESLTAGGHSIEFVDQCDPE